MCQTVVRLITISSVIVRVGQGKLDVVFIRTFGFFFRFGLLVSFPFVLEQLKSRELTFVRSDVLGTNGPLTGQHKVEPTSFVSQTNSLSEPRKERRELIHHWVI